MFFPRSIFTVYTSSSIQHGCTENLKRKTQRKISSNMTLDDSLKFYAAKNWCQVYFVISNTFGQLYKQYFSIYIRHCPKQSSHHSHKTHKINCAWRHMIGKTIRLPPLRHYEHPKWVPLGALVPPEINS